jgi:hypothetical protein
MNHLQIAGLSLAMVLFSNAAWAEENEDVDASDPTKVYSYAGPGYKFTEYSNGDSLSELRAVGNIGFSDNDMLLFEIGYGSYDGTIESGDKEDGVTNGRLRYFHLFNMDYSIAKGYRGWAAQVDLQFEGEVKGTNGGNTLAVGALPAYGLSPSWSFFLPLNVVSTWGNDFEEHQGMGVSIAPLLVWGPEKQPWPGFFLQIWPSFTRYVSGDLDGEGGAALDLTTGWSITPTIVATATFQQNFDKNLKFYSPGNGSSAPNDWNIFAAVNFYF